MMLGTGTILFHRIFNSRLARDQLLFILFFSSIATLVGTCIQLAVEYKADLNFLDRQLAQIQTSHLDSLANSLWVLDDRQIQVQLNNILSLRDIVYVKIDEKGRTLASAGTAPREKVRTMSYPMVHNRAGQVIQIGTLHAYASLRGVFQRMARRVFLILGTQALKTFVVSLAILLILYHKVIRHLILLSEFTRKMTLDSLDSPFSLDRGGNRRSDELDGLVDVFNHMRQRLGRDIETIRLTQDALKMRTQELSALLQANPDPFVVYDDNGYPKYLNPAFTTVFGWTVEELRARRIPFVPEDQQEITRKKSKELYRDQKTVKFSSRRLTKSGESVDVIISAALVKDPENSAQGMVVNLTDISDQKHLEAQLRQAQKMESVGRLAGGVAHDFNNMLSIIIGNVELILEDTGGKSPFQEELKEIQSAAERSGNLVRQLLAFARKQTVKPRVLDLNATTASMLSMLRRLIGEDISLTWRPGDGLWAVKMDPSQIDQILANLCVNARDAIAGTGRITIETQNIRFDETYCQNNLELAPGEYVMASFSDNGCGMDLSTLENLFDPFFTTKAVGQGTGLGMSTIYGIVKQNNGAIHVYSEPGRGTTIKIYIPRYRQESDRLTEEAAATEQGGRAETILLVEDEPAILKISTSLLRRLGYHVVPASGPGRAIELVENGGVEKIDLLMTDVVMPEMNGRELAQRLGSRFSGLKCLFMSGYTANVVLDQGILDHEPNFIHKPFSKTDLSRKLRDILDGPNR